MRDLAAHAAADARVVDVRDRVVAERVGIVPERQRGTAVQAHARVVARADVGVHAEARLDDLLARRERLARAGLLAPLALEHALVPGDDDLEPGHPRRQRLAQRLHHLGDAVGVHGADPRHAEAAQRVEDRHRHRLPSRVGSGGRHVVLARRGRVEVVEDHQHRVLLVAHRVRDPVGEAVVPEAAVAHDRDDPPAEQGRDGARRGEPHPVSEDRVTDVERRLRREGRAADVGRHVRVADLRLALAEDLHRAEHRPLGAARAERRRALGDRLRQHGTDRLPMRVERVMPRVDRRRRLRREPRLDEEAPEPADDELRDVLAVR